MTSSDDPSKNDDSGVTPEGEERQWGQRATEHHERADHGTPGTSSTSSPDSETPMSKDDEWPREAEDQ